MCSEFTGGSSNTSKSRQTPISKSALDKIVKAYWGLVYKTICNVMFVTSLAVPNVCSQCIRENAISTSLYFSRVTCTTGNVRSASLWLRRTKGVIIWPVDVSINSAMFVGLTGVHLIMGITMRMGIWSLFHLVRLKCTITMIAVTVNAVAANAVSAVKDFVIHHVGQL